jgi:capsule polysaccharide export protein KpsE/RkpR
VSDAVIDKFALQDRYRKKYREAAREALWKHCEVKVLPKPGLVQLSCEDRDPAFVQEMLGYFAEFGNQVFRRVSVSSASEEARTLEKRVGELRKAADEAAARIRAFQEEHQIVDLESQARGVVSAVAALNAQRLGKQMELEYARSFSARDEAGTRQLESQLSIVDDALRDLERSPEIPPAQRASGSGGKVRPPGLFPAALAVPRLRAEYEKLYRDRKVAEATLVFALDRLEGAKASEARDASTFMILDPPARPTRPARPPPVIPVLLGLGLAAGLAAGIALEWWRSEGRPGLSFVRQAFAPPARP